MTAHANAEALAAYNHKLDIEVECAFPPIILFFDADSEMNRKLFQSNYSQFQANERSANERRARWLNKMLKTNEFRVGLLGDLSSKKNYFRMKITAREWLEFAVSNQALSYMQPMFRWAQYGCPPADAFEAATDALQKEFPTGSQGFKTITQALLDYRELKTGKFTDDARMRLRDYMRELRKRRS